MTTIDTTGLRCASCACGFVYGEIGVAAVGCGTSTHVMCCECYEAYASHNQTRRTMAARRECPVCPGTLTGQVTRGSASEEL